MYTHAFCVVLIAIPDFVYYNEVDYNRVNKGAQYGKQRHILEQYSRVAQKHWAAICNANGSNVDRTDSTAYFALPFMVCFPQTPIVVLEDKCSD